MYPFHYHRPRTPEDAQEVFATAEDAVFLAGGQTLIPTLKQRLRQPSDVVDLGALTDLTGIVSAANVVTIGAMTRHADVASSADVRRLIPALAHLAGEIGDPQVRNRGTLGGSIANNDPAADYPGAVLALNAVIHTSRRVIAADDFFTNLFETALEPGELVLRVAFPVPRRAAYCKFPNPASRYAVAGVFVAETEGAVRVAVTGAGPCVFRHTAMEEALTRSFSVAALEGIETPADDLNADMHATPAYRAHLVGVMAARAVAAILSMPESA